MKFNDIAKLFGSYVANEFKRNAYLICSIAGLEDEDWEDILQDLLVRVLSKEGQHDPSKTQYKTYLTRLIRWARPEVLRSLKGRSADWSLSDLDEDLKDLHVKDLARSREKYVHNIDMALDVARFLEELPPLHREICVKYPHLKIERIPLKLIGSRRTGYRLKREIQEKAKAFGLAAYL